MHNRRHFGWIKEVLVDQIDDWRQRISEAQIDAALQTEIADKILELARKNKNLASVSEQVQYFHTLVQAVTGLSINVGSISQPTDAGFDKCLVALRKVVVQKEEADNSNSPNDDRIQILSYAKIVATIEKIKEQIVQKKQTQDAN